MKLIAKFVAVLFVSLIVNQSVAYACKCGMCVKTATPAQIGPEYPDGGVPVTYELRFDCQPDYPLGIPGQTALACGAITTVVDSLYTGSFGISPEAPYFFGPQLTEAFAPAPVPAFPEKFTYSINVTWDMCKALGTAQSDGSYKLTNLVTASGSPFEWGAPEFSCQQEVVCRPPETGFGCSRTPGYWKTHSGYGPAPYDATWASLLPNGEDSAFFLSGQTWYQVFMTDAGGGDAYYILARAYMAAKLNLLAGTSSTDEVDDAIAWAETAFFNVYGPASTLPKAVRSVAIAWAGILDNYNNGLTGPGHCE